MKMDGLDLRRWYEGCRARERTLVSGLFFILIWGVMQIVFQYPINALKTNFTKGIVEQVDAQNQLKANMTSFQIMQKSDVYLNWKKKKELMREMESKMLNQQVVFKKNQFDRVIEPILKDNSLVGVTRIHMLPEKKLDQKSPDVLQASLYDRVIRVEFYGAYNQVHQYISGLEEKIPYAHWHSLKYESTHYPMANVQLEFSVTYEN